MFEIVSKYRRSDMLMSPREIEGVIFVWEIPRRICWKCAFPINTLSATASFVHFIVRATVEFPLSQVHNDEILYNIIIK